MLADATLGAEFAMVTELDVMAAPVLVPSVGVTMQATVCPRDQ